MLIPMGNSMFFEDVRKNVLPSLTLRGGLVGEGRTRFLVSVYSISALASSFLALDRRSLPHLAFSKQRSSALELGQVP